MVIGDGCLDIHKRYRNARFTCMHSIKQKEYLLWKRSLLTASGFKTRYDEFWNTTNIHTGKRALMCRLESGVSETLTELRSKMYPKSLGFRNGILDDFEAIHLAIIFMDDGTRAFVNRRSGMRNSVRCIVECTPHIAKFRFCLQSHGVVGVRQFQDWMVGKFSINSRISMIKGSPVLEIGRIADKQRFVDIVKPFIHETMKYKIEGGFDGHIIHRERLSERTSSEEKSEGTIRQSELAGNEPQEVEPKSPTRQL